MKIILKNVECINKKYTSSIIFRGEVCSQKIEGILFEF